MAKAETVIVNKIIKAQGKLGNRLFRNTRGLFYTLDMSRKIKAGLGQNGCSDLIGFKQVVITPEMVGDTVAVFVAIEVKTATGKASVDQKKFCRFVKDSGGMAGIARSAEDAEAIVQYGRLLGCQ